jgi:rhodanese-related sulfurtransferase
MVFLTPIGVILTNYGDCAAGAQGVSAELCTGHSSNPGVMPMTSRVTETPAVSPAEVHAYYSHRLGRETDCHDVYEAMKAGRMDFVLVDVRSEEKFREAHVPGAIHMLVGKMVKSRLDAWPADTLFVVYCAGPHCNGTDKAARRLSELGRKVKVMIGGMTGWADEGYAYAHGEEPGSISQMATAK